jgi:hypothetical protein
MNFETSILLLLALLLSLPLVFGIINGLSHKNRLRGCIQVISLSLIPVLLLAASLYLDVGGSLVTGNITSKDERVEVRRAGDWRHTIRVAVSFQTSTNEREVNLDVDPALFDALSVGQQVEVRYLEFGRLFVFARLARQSTLTVIPWTLIRNAALIILPVILIWRLNQARSALRRPSILWWGALIMWIAGLGWFVALPRLNPAPRLQAVAHAQTITHYTQVEISSRRSSDVFDVPQPFDLVQLSFVPAGLHDPVLAVDAIDSGSVSRLEQGGNIAITYPENDPRAAAIDGAGYTHYWKNPLGYAGYNTIAILGFLALLTVGVFVFRKAVAAGFKALLGRVSRR